MVFHYPQQISAQRSYGSSQTYVFNQAFWGRISRHGWFCDAGLNERRAGGPILALGVSPIAFCLPLLEKSNLPQSGCLFLRVLPSWWSSAGKPRGKPASWYCCCLFFCFSFLLFGEGGWGPVLQRDTPTRVRPKFETMGDLRRNSHRVQACKGPLVDHRCLLMPRA